MNVLNRRSFLKGTSLGAGSILLQPVLQNLMAEAEGLAAPKRVIFFVEGNGMNPDTFSHKGLNGQRKAATN